MLFPDEAVLAAPALIWIASVIEQCQRRVVVLELESGPAAVGKLKITPIGVLS